MLSELLHDHLRSLKAAMFLTLEDPRARIQGSRDPLGVVPLWAAFGRHVVTNLTTVSTSVRGFTILMLARYLTERLIEHDKAQEKDALAIFLRMEQIGAYARHVGHEVEGDIRGIERVKRFVEEHGSRVPIQDNSSGWILSDQKTYGLWGLFSVPARVSGISADGPVGLTPFARDFVASTYWPTLKPVRNDLFKLLLDGGYLALKSNRQPFKAVAEILREGFVGPERTFYSETLRDGLYVKNGTPSGRQAHFAKLLTKHTDLSDPIGREELTALARAARDNDAALAARLDKILRLEALLAPAEAVFEYMQARQGQRPRDLAEALSDHLGRSVPHLGDMPFTEIAPEIEHAVGADITGVMRRCDSALVAGQYDQVVRALLKWNELVMAARKAAPWIRLASGRLEVRYRGNERELPDRKQLKTLWRNSYFIDSLKAVTQQLRRRA